jgi:hypothetical protein
MADVARAAALLGDALQGACRLHKTLFRNVMLHYWTPTVPLPHGSRGEEAQV